MVAQLQIIQIRTRENLQTGKCRHYFRYSLSLFACLFQGTNINPLSPDIHI